MIHHKLTRLVIGEHVITDALLHSQDIIEEDTYDPPPMPTRVLFNVL